MLLSASRNLHILDTSRKRHQKIFVFLYLDSSTEHNVFKTWTSFWLILPCPYKPLFVHPCTGWWTLGMFTSFGYYKWWCSENWHVGISLRTWWLGIHLKGELVPCMVILFSFLRYVKLFSKVDWSFYISISMYEGFNFSKFLPTLAIFLSSKV